MWPKASISAEEGANTYLRFVDQMESKLNGLSFLAVSSWPGALTSMWSDAECVVVTSIGLYWRQIDTQKPACANLSHAMPAAPAGHSRAGKSKECGNLEARRGGAYRLREFYDGHSSE